jgi:hypothetical protein
MIDRAEHPAYEPVVVDAENDRDQIADRHVMFWRSLPPAFDACATAGDSRAAKGKRVAVGSASH